MSLKEETLNMFSNGELITRDGPQDHKLRLFAIHTSIQGVHYYQQVGMINFYATSVIIQLLPQTKKEARRALVQFFRQRNIQPLQSVIGMDELAKSAML